jgi:hypothetical protein
MRSVMASLLAWLVIRHRISAAQMKACYKLADEWPDDYAQDIRKYLWYRLYGDGRAETKESMMGSFKSLKRSGIQLASYSS